MSESIFDTIHTSLIIAIEKVVLLMRTSCHAASCTSRSMLMTLYIMIDLVFFYHPMIYQFLFLPQEGIHEVDDVKVLQA